MKETNQQDLDRRKCPRVHYKVWVEIERFDEHTEDGVNMDAPGGALAEFDTYQEAYEFAESLAQTMTSPRLPRG